MIQDLFFYNKTRDKKFKEINIDNYMVHYKGASCTEIVQKRLGPKLSVAEWLNENKQYYTHPSKNITTSLTINKIKTLQETTSITDTNEKKIDICCIAKREWLTINDWVDYHLNMGFHKIWIYQNDGVGNTILKKLLRKQILAKKVVILDDFASKQKQQLPAYNHFIQKHNKTNEYDWVGFLDCDEYFDYNHNLYTSLSDYFTKVESRCKNIGVLRLNWECYGDNGQYFYDDRPVVERFPRPMEKTPYCRVSDANFHVKSFLKAGVTAHFPSVPHNCIPIGKYLAYESDFSVANATSPFYKKYNNTHAKIKHYLTKSLEEFLYRKAYLNIGGNGLTGYNLDYYWRINKKTPEALAALEKLKKDKRLKPIKHIK